MEDQAQQRHERARSHVQASKGFYIHAIVSLYWLTSAYLSSTCLPAGTGGSTGPYEAGLLDQQLVP
jgi:hypothetical protein